MELICQTLCALMLFLCGALVRGGLPERKKRQYPARDWDR